MARKLKLLQRLELQRRQIQVFGRRPAKVRLPQRIRPKQGLELDFLPARNRPPGTCHAAREDRGDRLLNGRLASAVNVVGWRYHDEKVADRSPKDALSAF